MNIYFFGFVLAKVLFKSENVMWISLFDKDIWTPWPVYSLCSTGVCGCGSGTERKQQSSLSCSVSLSAVCHRRSPRGYVPGKDFTAVCWIQTRRGSQPLQRKVWRALPFVLAYLAIRGTGCEWGFESLVMKKRRSHIWKWCHTHSTNQSQMKCPSPITLTVVTLAHS